jgi:type IV pilus assembly protein PilM
MHSAFRERLRVAFAPLNYLSLPFSGIDISTSGVKVARISSGTHGLILSGYADARLPLGAYADGEIVDRASIVKVLESTASAAGVSSANVALSESKSYLFETTVSGTEKTEWRTLVEQRLDELIPLPPTETVFDVVKTGNDENGGTRVMGIGFARRIVDDTLSIFDQANIKVCALEGETFASSRALLPRGDNDTILIIDIGRTTTKISIVARRIPLFATTIGIGGHSLTLAVQKHFGVTEFEARKVKDEHGIVPAPGNENYLEAMLSTVSAIRDEISRRLEYWQEKAALGGAHEPVTRAILTGGNASVRGLPEYLENFLKIPVTAGDIFTNFASRDTWVPSLDYNESLAYATAVGLAMRDYEQFYE